MNEHDNFRPQTAEDIIDDYIQAVAIGKTPTTLISGPLEGIKREYDLTAQMYTVLVHKCGELAQELRSAKSDLNVQKVLNDALEDRIDVLTKRNDILTQKVKALYDEREQSFAYRLAKYLKE